MKSVVKAVLPEGVRRRLKEERRRARRSRLAHWLARGRARSGGLLRRQPLRRAFGVGAGRSVDRHYIEAFLERHAADVRGRVLELADDSYTRRFGGERVERSDVLHKTADNPRATVVADLCDGDGLPSDAWECVILTQTLQFVPDPDAALRTVHRILKPGGVALVTAPGISQISRYDMERWGDRWRFTSLGLEELVRGVFEGGEVKVEAHGNLLAAVALLSGVVLEEVRPEELEPADDDYHVVVTARAVKAGGS